MINFNQINEKVKQLRMEDSGFDSGDRVANFMQNYKTNNVESESSTSYEDILNVNRQKTMPISDNIDDVAFRNPSTISKDAVTQSITASSTHDMINHQKQFSHNNHHLNEHNKKIKNIDTCKSLHRKLEEKVNRAKKNFLHNEKVNQMENEYDGKKSLQNLISIERLPFPRSNTSNVYQKPLVEYKSDNSDDEDDEVTTFFPIHKKPKSRLRKQQQQQQHEHRHKEVDTFSIQEMTIIESDSEGNDGDKSSDDDDDCDSQLNLELPSRTNESFFDKMRQFVCCVKSSQNIF